MDYKIKELFEDTVNHDLAGIIISNSTDKARLSKIKIRPVLIKEILLFQITEYIGEKVFHANLSKDEIIDKLPEWFEGLFRQAEIATATGKATLLISKKGKATIQNKTVKTAENNKVRESACSTKVQSDILLHNRKKNYILEEGIPLPFLIDLGVMSEDGFLIKSKSDKFKQINRFLEFIEDILPYLDYDRELTILDFGCGKSYLTFALYYYLKILKGYQINVTGMDLKADVISECNRLSEIYGYDRLHFLAGDIASYQGTNVDMVVTLHACDTATDFALYHAISWNARVILSVPCCQHELNKQLQSDILKPVLKYGIIKERMAALITDALRADILEAMGYHVQLLEFIDMEHTPKNILIRAVRNNPTVPADQNKNNKLEECMNFLNVTPCLYKLIREDGRKE